MHIHMFFRAVGSKPLERAWRLASNPTHATV
jgi:hypothetical protein